MNQIYSYNDYRDYLKDFYQESKATRNSFSFRFFARRAGLNSPNYLKLVMDGKKKISNDIIFKFSKGLNLNKKEAKYFEALVKMNQCSSDEEKLHYWENLNRLRRVASNLTNIDDGKILLEWYHLSIREMITLKDFRNDPEWIARRLRNLITKKQAKESINFLLQNNYIVEQKGKLEQTQKDITVDSQVASAALKQFYKKTIPLALEIMDKTPKEERSIESVTIAVKKSEFERIKKELHEFIINAMQSVDTKDTDEVCQLGIQFVTLTNKDERNKE